MLCIIEQEGFPKSHACSLTSMRGSFVLKPCLEGGGLYVFIGHQYSWCHYCAYRHKRILSHTYQEYKFAKPPTPQTELRTEHWWMLSPFVVRDGETGERQEYKSPIEFYLLEMDLIARRQKVMGCRSVVIDTWRFATHRDDSLHEVADELGVHLRHPLVQTTMHAKTKRLIDSVAHMQEESVNLGLEHREIVIILNDKRWRGLYLHFDWHWPM